MDKVISIDLRESDAQLILNFFTDMRAKYPSKDEKAAKKLDELISVLRGSLLKNDSRVKKLMGIK